MMCERRGIDHDVVFWVIVSYVAVYSRIDYRSIRSVSNLPATFLLNSFLSKLAPLTNYITDSVSSFNSASESDI